MIALRNIIAIDRVQVGEIAGLRKLNTSSVTESLSTPWESISIKIPAKLVISEKIEDGVRLYTAQLTFRTCENLSDKERWAYRCKTADGRYYLIGNNDRPYPIGLVTTNLMDNMTDSQLDEVTINYTSASKIPYIV